MKVLVLVFASCLVYSSAYENKNIVQWLTDNGYMTLIDLLQRANLTSTLSTKGPYTIFAPTDAAFAKVSKARLDALKADPAKLQEVLEGHVVRGYVLGPQVAQGKNGTALNSDILIYGTPPTGGQTVDGANIISGDNILNNGVVHGIDTVLLPFVPVTDTIPEVLLRQDGRFGDLDVLMAITGLKGALSSGNFTLFAPTDSSWHAISASLPLFTESDAVHKYTGLRVDGASVVERDVGAVNGVIHVIDKVLVPSDL